jgi:hypothetical protein
MGSENFAQLGFDKHCNGTIDVYLPLVTVVVLSHRAITTLETVYGIPYRRRAESLRAESPETGAGLDLVGHYPEQVLCSGTDAFEDDEILKTGHSWYPPPKDPRLTGLLVPRVHDSTSIQPTSSFTDAFRPLCSPLKLKTP